MSELRPYQKQYLKELATAWDQGHKSVLINAPCGSGKTVLFAMFAKGAQDNGKTVWFLVHRKELLQQTIETFERFKIPLRTIHIGMVGTYANHLDEYPPPDLIVFDECHFSAASTWQKILTAFPDAYLIGLTATPARLDGKPLGVIYKKMISVISVRELIEQGYLSDYRYFAPSVADVSELPKRGSDFDPEKAAEILNSRAVFGDVIAHWRKYAEGKQTICYCTTRAHSRATAEAFREAGIEAVHFDGETPKRERERIVASFREGKIKVLCNVDLISVGFDCPDCECCILLRPTLSLALFIQQSMRCMRPKQGKTAIILDHVNNYTRFGLPDEPRDWSLTEKIKQREAMNEAGMLKTRMCEKCFCTYSADLPACPYCGEPYKTKPIEIKRIKEIQLEEIKTRRKTEAEEKVKELDTPNKCRSFAELQAYAKKKGYKPQWAYIQAKNRGWFKK